MSQGRSSKRFLSQFKRVETGVVDPSLNNNYKRAKYLGIDTQCPRCMRKLKNPDKDHYSDPKNMTPCLSFKV